MTLINILTRTGTRETYFKTLKESIEKQTYKNIRHIKSNDNPNCKFLENEIDVFNVKKNETLGEAFYNTYLNEIGQKTNNGWIIILDDDSKLIDNTFIEKLVNECNKSNENDILIYQSYLHEKKPNKPIRIIPDNSTFKNNLIKKYCVDMACMCFHYSVLNNFKFDGRKMGDINFLEKIKKNKNYKFKFIKLPIGIWANYDGQKLGKN